MNLKVWAIFVLVVTTAGCAISERTAPSNLSAQTSANQNDVLVGSNGEDFANGDFDLLEEELAEKKVDIADPLEGVNRLMYGLNDVLHFWVLEPCASICKAVVPEPARIGIHNFFNNLTTPVRFVNCLLQGKGEAAGTEFERFVVNTTVGVLGFGDPAKDQYGLEPVAEDLGQTLAVHGFENGFYIVLPLLGPSTVRDSVGKVGDLFLNPVFYLEPTEAAVGTSAVKITNENSFRIGEYEVFKSAAVDPYVAMREAYIQYRNKQIEE
jgi:phospholipid-binding lipoprotein MlaA